MDNIVALSTMKKVLQRLNQLEASIEAQEGSSVERVFELMTAREIVEGLRKEFDDDSVCQDSIDRIDQLMEQLEISRTTDVSEAEPN